MLQAKKVITNIRKSASGCSAVGMHVASHARRFGSRTPAKTHPQVKRRRYGQL